MKHNPLNYLDKFSLVVHEPQVAPGGRASTVECEVIQTGLSFQTAKDYLVANTAEYTYDFTWLLIKSEWTGKLYGIDSQGKLKLYSTA